MPPIVIALIEEIGKDILIAELPVVMKYIQFLEAKVPKIGFKHIALAEINVLLGDIQSSLQPQTTNPA
jgi:hypothetical protein